MRRITIVPWVTTKQISVPEIILVAFRGKKGLHLLTLVLILVFLLWFHDDGKCFEKLVTYSLSITCIISG